jgi:hypothetical protein
MPPRPAADLLDEILSAAARHGLASEPDHEVGDLQDALRAAWSLLAPRQRRGLYDAHFRLHDHWIE